MNGRRTFWGALAGFLFLSSAACSEKGQGEKAAATASTRTGTATLRAASSNVSTEVANAPKDPYSDVPNAALLLARKSLGELMIELGSPDPGQPAASIVQKSITSPYYRFQMAVSEAEPFIRERGFMAAALVGDGPADESFGALGRLYMAIDSGDSKVSLNAAKEVDRALLLLSTSLEKKPIGRNTAPRALPMAVFSLGLALAGAKPGLPRSELLVIATTRGILGAIQNGLAAYSQLVSPTTTFSESATATHGHIETLEKALDSAEKIGELRGRAALIVETGRLFAEVRGMLGEETAWLPYEPRFRASSSPRGEPISPLTLPTLRRHQSSGGKEAQMALAALGKRLFSDKALSEGGNRSCATCHVPDRSYSDGLATAKSLDPNGPPLRNTPTLLYAPLSASQFWDGRALTSEKQALLVMHSKAEMGGVNGVFPMPLAKTQEEAAAALTAFQVQMLIPGSSPIDRFARGEKGAMSEEALAGFDVFAGVGKCTRCHVPPSFGGSRPPDFATTVYAVLGVPKDPSAKVLDPDKGRGAFSRSEVDLGAFRTPTLRNVSRTAPYFHNGAFPSLESVIDFYDKGGGRGQNLPVQNQDPDILPLKLKAIERKVLLHFLRTALND